MLIELRYQCYIHACSGNYLGNIFLLFFLSFSDFLCEASGWCVSERPEGSLVCPDGDSSYPDDTVDSSRRPFFLSRRVCAISYVALRPDVT
jgi:hypothetical protein